MQELEPDRITVTPTHGMAWFRDGTVVEYDQDKRTWVITEEGPLAARCVGLIAKWSIEAKGDAL